MDHRDIQVAKFLKETFEKAVKYPELRERVNMYLPQEHTVEEGKEQEVIEQLVNEVGDDVLPFAENEEEGYALPKGTKTVLVQFFGQACPHCAGSSVLITFLGTEQKVLGQVTAYLG